MDLVQARRQATQWSINQNPTTITIKRTRYEEYKGARRKVEEYIGPLTVRIYQARRRVSANERTSEAGSMTVMVWGMLALYDADLMNGPNVRQEFEVEGLGTFRITQVKPQIINQQVVSKQAELELVM